MKTRKSLTAVILTAVLAIVFAMPAFAAKTPVVTEDFSNADLLASYAGQDEIGIEATSRYGRSGIRFFFTTENTDIFPQANRWIEPMTGKVYMEVSFLVGELKERQIIQAPSNPAWWPYIGVIMMGADGALTLGVADQGETMPVPGGEAIAAEEWYDLTVLMDYDSQTMTAWVGDMPAAPSFVAFPVEAAEMMAVNVQLNNSGDRGVYYSALVVGNYTDVADFAGGAEDAPVAEAPDETPAAPAEDGRLSVEQTVDNAIADGIVTDRAYWIAILNGDQLVNPQHLQTMLDNIHKQLNP
jgi:hypothetical protein